jgi:hypothetical protein
MYCIYHYNIRGSEAQADFVVMVEAHRLNREVELKLKSSAYYHPISTFL